ncbi:unnamed protein product [Linum trigynum]|uniref:Uncharacterized protein n=1 Tax=Linum trigynum TaxID=586398 RepID=A0AAV2FB37_9ROSI
MLSTATNESLAPAPSLFPFDRPPDTATSPTAFLSSDTGAGTPATEADMLIDSISTVVHPRRQENGAKAVIAQTQPDPDQGRMAASPTKPQAKFSYATALTG